MDNLDQDIRNHLNFFVNLVKFMLKLKLLPKPRYRELAEEQAYADQLDHQGRSRPADQRVYAEYD